MQTYDKKFAEQLNDNERYKILFDVWNIKNSKIEAWGRLGLSHNENWAGIKQVKLLSGNSAIEYPLLNSRDLQSGVFLSPKVAKQILNGKNAAWIKCELKLASEQQRTHRDNPFLLQVMPSSVEQLIELPKFDTSDVVQSDLSTLISDNVFHFFLNQRHDKKLAAEKESEQLIEEVKKRTQRESQQLASGIESLNKEQNGLMVKIQELHDINDELSIKKESIESVVRNKNNEIELLAIKQEKIEQDMMKKIEKLKQYIEEKASFLKDFEFIDEDVYANLSNDKREQKPLEKGLSFTKDFHGDYAQLVSYLQAYLKEQGQYYSRHIIENYLTLLRTNDLIILAGDSGSGKTSLVQTFAKAVGGVAKVIPVKPNWTSSEDLLGYYNPLEKRYLATPFLEALLEAKQNPDTPYFICLDEMNLARVEYYFADFLSKLEERKQQPDIQLYSDDEAAHVLSELRGVVSIISGAKDKYNKNGIVDFIQLMQDEEVNAEIKRAFGFSDKDSLIKYHGEIRRMLSGVIGIPSTITIPSNVRIVGAINIDETTHYLSPKILDRAHIMKFKSPLLTDWKAIEQEIENYGLNDVTKPVYLTIDELGVRETYPNFTPADEFCRLFTDFNREHFHPLGVEFGMRTIRQGLNYLGLFREANSNDQLALNNFLLHKVLPKFTFDGSKPIGNTDKLTHIERVFYAQVEDKLSGLVVKEEFSALESIREITEAAKANDDVVNYWA